MGGALLLPMACDDARMRGGGLSGRTSAEALQRREDAEVRVRSRSGSGGASSGGSGDLGGAPASNGGATLISAGGASQSSGGATVLSGGSANTANGGQSQLGGSAGAAGASGEGEVPRCAPVGESDPNGPVRFAIFGDYGSVGEAEASVAALVKSWRVDFIATAGDNNYPVGGADTLDANIGQFFAEFICPYRGNYGRGATKNRFFPALGNHDWYTAGAEPYLDYFELPGNERYYDFVWNSVHLFMLDTDPSEPDGVTSDSRQAAWLERGLATSTARWKIVVMHHPPYSSALHGSTSYTQWPYKQWGADLVFAGHDHTYERVQIDGLTFIVSGLGGASTYGFNTTIEGSRTQYNAGYGAGLVEADATRFRFRFFSVDGSAIDEFTLARPAW